MGRLTTQQGLRAARGKRSRSVRRLATALCSLAVAGGALFIAPSAAGAAQAPAANSGPIGNPLGNLGAEVAALQSELATLSHDLQIALPTLETCITNLGQALATALGQGGTPQPGQPLC